jgi:hypothetical protein
MVKRKTENVMWHFEGGLAGISVNSALSRHVQDCANMNRSAPESGPVPFATPSVEAARTAFHFGSGRQYSTSVKQKKCIIHRAQTQPALFGLRAQSLSSRLSA